MISYQCDSMNHASSQCHNNACAQRLRKVIGAGIAKV